MVAERAAVGAPPDLSVDRGVDGGASRACEIIPGLSMDAQSGGVFVAGPTLPAPSVRSGDPDSSDRHHVASPPRDEQTSLITLLLSWC